MLPGLISLYTQGTSKEVAIVVGDSDSFSSGSEIDEDEPLQVKGESKCRPNMVTYITTASRSVCGCVAHSLSLLIFKCLLRLQTG